MRAFRWMFLPGMVLLAVACHGGDAPVNAPEAPAAPVAPSVPAPVETAPPAAVSQPPATSGVSAPHAAPAPAQASRITIEEVASGLEVPWSLAFLPDGRMLVTERTGRLRYVGADGAVSAPIEGVPAVHAQGQGGLLDVALSPTFSDDGLIYLSYAEPGEGDSHATTALGRGRLAGDRIENWQVIFRQEPRLASGHHFGSRIVFDGEGHLFLALGENNQRPTSQKLDHLQGKVVRLHLDGSVPADNPFVGQEGVRPEIWSYGHRNQQGAARHPVTGALWTSEHGPRGGDEVNIPAAAKNYGWPLATYGINYSGQPIPEALGTAAPDTEQPHYYFERSPGLSGMTFYTHERFPAWKDSLFLGGMATMDLIRLQLDGDTIVAEERLLGERKTRVRDVRQGPDGHLYLLSEADGKILRLGLAK